MKSKWLNNHGIQETEKYKKEAYKSPKIPTLNLINLKHGIETKS